VDRDWALGSVRGRPTGSLGTTAVLRGRVSFSGERLDRRRPRTRGPRRGSRSGFSLIEVVIAISVLLFGLLGFSQAVLRSVKTNDATREEALASEAARRMLETLQSQEFADVFRLYNANPNDDPGLPGSAPGANFAVAGLNALADDADGFVGEIIFPVNAGAPGVLREDVVSIPLGMPRDIDGDEVLDAADHSDDYRVLPVVVRITWRGSATTERVDFRTVLGNFQ
jgi:prepilin-type N-terminal cleavage/methylation domain-containing protein